MTDSKQPVREGADARETGVRADGAAPEVADGAAPEVADGAAPEVADGAAPEVADKEKGALQRTDDAVTVNRQLAELYCPVCDKSFQAEGASFCPTDGVKLVRLSDKQDSLLGRVLDERFTIKAKIGQGGMGAVYRALQHSVGRQVAIKIIEPRLAGNRDITKRFLREAQLSSRLSQPNTVSVLDFGQTADGLLYLVMELLAGRSLEEILRGGGGLSEERVLRIGIQICDALDAAQSLHIVHRDLKPGNVVILDDPPGRDMAKVLDFGIAKSLAGGGEMTNMTKSDMIMGTPSYIAPEAIEGMKIDARADLYSLGIMLYEMITGKLPFDATTVGSMLNCHTSLPPRPLPDTVSQALRQIIEKLLSKSPGDRYQSAAEARAALGAAERRRAKQSSALATTAAPGDPDSDSPIAYAATSATPASALAGTRAGQGPRGPTLDATGEALDSESDLNSLRGPDRSKRFRGTFVLALGFGGIAAIAAVVAISSMGDDSDASGATADAAAPTIANQPADAAAPTIANQPADAGTGEDTGDGSQITFDLDSVPRGARVVLRPIDAANEKLDTLLCEATPCTGPEMVTHPSARKYANLWFFLDGYKGKKYEVDLMSPKPVRKKARLQKRRLGNKTGPGKSGGKSGKGDGKGSKLDGKDSKPSEGFLKPKGK